MESSSAPVFLQQECSHARVALRHRDQQRVHKLWPWCRLDARNDLFRKVFQSELSNANHGGIWVARSAAGRENRVGANQQLV